MAKVEMIKVGSYAVREDSKTLHFVPDYGYWDPVNFTACGIQCDWMVSFREDVRLYLTNLEYLRQHPHDRNGGKVTFVVNDSGAKTLVKDHGYTICENCEKRMH